jgi:hypothetical protein
MSSNTNTYYKIGGPHSTPTVIDVSGKIGVQNSTPEYSIDSSGMIRSHQSLWGSAKSISDGVVTVDLNDCNMVTCTLTENTVISSTGGHDAQQVGFVFTEDSVGDHTVGFGATFVHNGTRSYGPNIKFSLLFQYYNGIWNEIPTSMIYPSGSVSPSGIVYHNTLVDLQGGVANQYYHLDMAQYGNLHLPATVTDPISILGQQIGLKYDTGDFDLSPAGELEINWQQVPDQLPPGTTNQSLRYDDSGWLANNTLLIDESLGIAVPASGYVNFNIPFGTTGYGFRDNIGNIQYKNLGGAWTNIQNPSGVIDHGNLTGLTDQADHTWALLVDGSRPLTADWDIGNGRTIEAESIIARDADGLVLREDSDTYGIQIEDDGDIVVTLGDNAGVRRINILDSDGVVESIISSDGDIAAAGSGHYNFGSTLGDTGYGFRDTGSKVQFKHPAGSWIDVGTGGGGTPGGTDTQVQFNDATTFGGDAGLTYNKTSNTVTMGKGIRTEGHANGVVAEIPSMIYIASGVIAPAASGYAIGTVLLVYNP